jgi:NADPH:quinone reductase-like Zn-dependent oxidoreductase
VEDVIGIDDEQEIGKLRDLDAIADTIGGPTMERLLGTIRSGGVLGSVLGKPASAEKFPIRVEAFMALPDASRLRQLADDAARGDFLIPIARTMKLAEIQEAHRIAERGGEGGKIILIP